MSPPTEDPAPAKQRCQRLRGTPGPGPLAMRLIGWAVIWRPRSPAPPGRARARVKFMLPRADLRYNARIEVGHSGQRDENLD
jgi:hypothetical protein